MTTDHLATLAALYAHDPPSPTAVRAARRRLHATMQRAPRRRVVRGGVLAVGAGAAIAAAGAALPLGGDRARTTTGGGGVAAGLGLAPAPASAAELRPRVARALAAHGWVLHQVEWERLDGRRVRSDLWLDDREGGAMRQLERDADNRPVLETAMRPLRGGGVESIQIAPQQRVYSLVAETGEPKSKPGASTAPPPPPAWRSQGSIVLDDLAHGAATLVGPARVHGRPAWLVAEHEAGLHREVYVDRASYLPIRLVEHPDGVGAVTIDYVWTPRSAASVATTWPEVPHGFRRVDPAQFPIRD